MRFDFIQSDWKLISGAALLYFLLSVITIRAQQRAILKPNPNVFVRTVLSGMLIKMFATVLGIFFYIRLVNPYYRAAAVWTALLIYAAFLAAEVYLGGQLNKRKA
jgi:hypothetical protein